MSVVGIGTQVVECDRVRRLIDRHGEAFLAQVYTDREVRACHARPRSTEQFAAVWAAKEAVFRAVGLTWRPGVAWTDVEVVHEPGTQPRAVVTGPTADRLAARGVGSVMLTTAHTRAFATATAVALAAAAPERVNHG